MKFLERFWNGCGHCTGEEACPALQAAARTYDAHPWFRGHRIVFVAIAIFLVPLASGILGAAAAEHYAPQLFGHAGPGWQAPGLLLGLAVGVGLAKLLVAATRLTRFVRRGRAPVGDSA